MRTVPLDEAKDRLPELVNQVQSSHERVTITRNGDPAVVMMAADDLESLEETLFWLSRRGIREDLAEAQKEIAEGRTLSAEQLRRSVGTMRPMDQVRVSKLLSKVLRHAPASACVALDRGGWVPVRELLAGLAARGTSLSRADLERVVAGSDKRRFELDEPGDRIRARQGHSVPVDLGLIPVPPPGVLFHGTPERNLPGILRTGLVRGRRHHVHLSPDVDTATRVGARRGRPVVLTVDAAAMAHDGHAFYLTSNGVWLTDAVPPHYLAVP